MTAVVTGVGGSLDLIDRPNRVLGIVTEADLDVPLSTVRAAVEAVSAAVAAVQERALPDEQIAALSGLPPDAAREATLLAIRGHVDTLEELLGRLPATGAASEARLLEATERLVEIRDRLPTAGLASEQTLGEVRDRLPGPTHAMLDKVAGQLLYLGRAPAATPISAPEWTITKYRYAAPADEEPIEWDTRAGISWDGRAGADWTF